MNLGTPAANPHDVSLAHLVEKACKHWDLQRAAAARRRESVVAEAPHFTIAMSREVGTRRFRSRKKSVAAWAGTSMIMNSSSGLPKR